jgi:TonB family protein
MRKLLVLVIFLTQLVTFGQETKEVKVKFPKSNQIKELYYVLKSNPEIKEGEYTKFYKTSKRSRDLVFIKSKGTYKNGLKDGKWTSYNHQTNNTQGTISSVEFYLNGQETGIWELYIYKNGDQIIKKYDHDQKKEIEPEILIALKYPTISKEQGIEGDVVIRFTQNTDCTFENLKIIESLNVECDNEVLRQFKRLSELQKRYGIRTCEKKDVTTTVTFRLMQ